MKKKIYLILFAIFMIVPFAVKAETEVTSADTLIATIDGRNYYKKNDGAAYVAYANMAGLYTGPVLVGKTAESVAYYSPDHATCGNIQSLGSFIFRGEVYYYSSNECWMKGTFENTGSLNLNKYYTGMIFNDGIKHVAMQMLHSTVSDSKLIAVFSGRKYYKTNNEDAFIAYSYNGEYTGPILVGETPTSVDYYSPDHPYCNNINATGKFKYLGKTYYYSNPSCWMLGDLTNTGSIELSKYNGLTSDVAMQIVKDNVGSAMYYVLICAYVLLAVIVCGIMFILGKKSGVKKASNV